MEERKTLPKLDMVRTFGTISSSPCLYLQELIKPQIYLFLIIKNRFIKDALFVYVAVATYS